MGTAVAQLFFVASLLYIIQKKTVEMLGNLIDI
jgi:hypothetical protein